MDRLADFALAFAPIIGCLLSGMIVGWELHWRVLVRSARRRMDLADAVDRAAGLERARADRKRSLL